MLGTFCGWGTAVVWSSGWRACAILTTCQPSIRSHLSPHVSHPLFYFLEQQLLLLSPAFPASSLLISITTLLANIFVQNQEHRNLGHAQAAVPAYPRTPPRLAATPPTCPAAPRRPHVPGKLTGLLGGAARPLRGSARGPQTQPAFRREACLLALAQTDRRRGGNGLYGSRRSRALGKRGWRRSLASWNVCRGSRRGERLGLPDAFVDRGQVHRHAHGHRAGLFSGVGR